uniref:ATP synthase B chain n=1 Tax=Rhodymenia pseudopalmata TaxID=31502 RepID=V9NGB1_RHOPU|nr:hypothetical protein Rhody.mt.08 [Rhodymenia pseudopalmata]AGO19263.1 hypothetical protein Rhody.mt.08 [Rhodymenia pseudopalmata]
MLNFSFLLLFSLFLISQNIFLLNEESLILLCFVIFCWLVFDKIQALVALDFDQRSDKIQISLKDSLDQVIDTSIKNLELQKQLESINLELQLLKKHFIDLNSLISAKLCDFSVQQTKSVFYKKLLFAQRLEQQMAKLLTLLIFKKLSKIVLLNFFYTQNLQIPIFLCLNKIALRECLENI